MKVYRLEREGYGPFFMQHNPVPTVKGLMKPRFKEGDIESDFLYGCLSHNQLQSYFGPVNFEKLKQAGYKLLKLEVPETAVRFAWDNGEVEVAFHKQYRDKILT